SRRRRGRNWRAVQRGLAPRGARASRRRSGGDQQSGMLGPYGQSAQSGWMHHGPARSLRGQAPRRASCAAPDWNANPVFLEGQPAPGWAGRVRLNGWRLDSDWEIDSSTRRNGELTMRFASLTMLLLTALPAAAEPP